jgi:hypothetical protein
VVHLTLLVLAVQVIIAAIVLPVIIALPAHLPLLSMCVPLVIIV